MALPAFERTLRVIAVVSICWIGVTVECGKICAEEAARAAWPSVVPGETAVTRKIRRALDGPTQMDFEEAPLDEQKHEPETSDSSDEP